MGMQTQGCEGVAVVQAGSELVIPAVASPWWGVPGNQQQVCGLTDATEFANLHAEDTLATLLLLSGRCASSETCLGSGFTKLTYSW